MGNYSIFTFKGEKGREVQYEFELGRENYPCPTLFCPIEVKKSSQEVKLANYGPQAKSIPPSVFVKFYWNTAMSSHS